SVQDCAPGNRFPWRSHVCSEIRDLVAWTGRCGARRYGPRVPSTGLGDPAKGATHRETARSDSQGFRFTYREGSDSVWMRTKVVLSLFRSTLPRRERPPPR